MSVDTNLSLPPNVRVTDVARVLGALHGLPVKLEPLQGGDGLACEVRGANVHGHVSIPQMATIVLRAPNGDEVASFNYHFESRGGRRLVTARATARAIAAFIRAAEFFGGVVDYRDNDDEEDDFVRPDGSDEENHAEDGEPWEHLQIRMAHVTPLTKREIARLENVAAY